MLITSDLHVHWYNDNEYIDGVPLKLKEILDVVIQICDYAINNNIKKIIIAGDIGEKKNIVDTRAFVRLQEIFNSYPSLHFVLLGGNHDISNRSDYISSVQLFNGLDNITTITKPQIIDGIYYVPYTNTMIDDIVNFNEHEKAPILVSHLGLSDAILSSGISLQSRLKSSDLNKFSLVFLGHFHMPQFINNVWYCGSPVPLRADEKEDKRFLVVDSETLEVESIPTTGYRRYHEFVITDDNVEDALEILKQAESLKENGHHIKIKKEVQEIPSEVLEEVSDSLVIVDAYEPEIEIRGISTDMSMKDQMLKYLEIQNIPKDSHEKYLKIGLEVLGNE